MRQISTILLAILMICLFATSFYVAYMEGRASVMRKTRVMAFDNEAGVSGSYFGDCLRTGRYSFCTVDKPDEQLLGLAKSWATDDQPCR